MPKNTTALELTSTLGKKAVGYYVVYSDQISTAADNGVIGYLVGQTSEKLAQLTIQKWRHAVLFPGFKLKYQLEIDYPDVDAPHHPKPGEELSQSLSTSHSEDEENDIRKYP